MILSTNQHLPINQLAVVLFVLLVVVHNGGQAKERNWEEHCSLFSTYDKTKQIRYYQKETKTCYFHDIEAEKKSWNDAKAYCETPALRPALHFDPGILPTVLNKDHFKAVIDHFNEKLKSLGKQQLNGNGVGVWSGARREIGTSSYRWRGQHKTENINTADQAIWLGTKEDGTCASDQMCCAYFEARGQKYGLKVQNKHGSCGDYKKHVICAFEAGIETQLTGAANRPNHSNAIPLIWVFAVSLLVVRVRYNNLN